MPRFVPLLPADQLRAGEALCFAIVDHPDYENSLDDLDETLRIAMARVDGVVYAIEDLCSHDGGNLGTGPLDGTMITCPRHGARFDMTTGKPTRLPAIAPVRSFPARLNDGMIEVDLEDV